MLPNPSRLRPLTAAFLIAAILLLLFSSLAHAGEKGIWATVKTSIGQAGQKLGAFFKEANRAYLKFFRKDAKEATREIKRGSIEAGKKTQQALKDAGKETGKSLKRTAQETNKNLKNAGKEIREAWKGTK